MRSLSAVLVMSLVAVPAWAADTEGFYASAGGGAYRIDTDGFDDVAPTFRLLGGYDFNQYFALEGAYMHLFEAHDRVAGARAEIDGNVWEVAGKVSYPLTERVSAYGRLGWSFYDLDGKFSAEGVSVSADEKDDDFMWGLGASMALTDRISLRGEYAQIEQNGSNDNDFLSMHVTYRIGN